MKLRHLVPLLLILPAFGAGGTCPSGANYVPQGSVTGAALVTLATLGVTNCYYVAANGSDGNAGTTEGFPWFHSPQMPNCSSACATVQNQGGGVPAGTGIIFRGGDTWHEGITTDSAGQPAVGGKFDVNTGAPPQGTSSHPIYFGVDKTWFTGGSWTRPIMTGDNPIQANSAGHVGAPGTIGAYVLSCPHQIGSTNSMVGMTFVSYITFDNWELTGLCQSNTGQPGGHNNFIDYGAPAAGTVITNTYIHGWTHLQYNVNNDCGGANTSVCFDSSVYAGGGGGVNPGETLAYNVIDGSDSDPSMTAFAFPGFFNAYGNVWRYFQSGTYRYLHTFHDNLIEHTFSADDGFSHSNLLQSDGEFNGTDVIYNNLIRHVCTDSGACPVSISGLIQQNSPVGFTQYLFNNVMYDTQSIEYIGLNSGSASNIGTKVYFNNTWQNNDGGHPIMTCAVPISGAFPFTVANNHYITDNANPIQPGCAPQETTSPITELHRTIAQATSDGYTSAETFAYSPPTVGSITVGAGTNEGTQNLAFCSALTTAAGSDSLLSDAATACQQDTSYACSYNSGNNTVSCPARTAGAKPASAAWDVGAYQFGGSNNGTPGAPFSWLFAMY